MTTKKSYKKEHSISVLDTDLVRNIAVGEYVKKEESKCGPSRDSSADPEKTSGSSLCRTIIGKAEYIPRPLLIGQTFN